MTMGIGSSPRRVEDRRLLTGAGSFSDDVSLPGQVHAFVLRSPHGHARIAAIDTRAAAGMPGGPAGRARADLVSDGIKPFAHAPAAQHPPDILLENTDGSAFFVSKHFPLAVERGRFGG